MEGAHATSSLSSSIPVRWLYLALATGFGAASASLNHVFFQSDFARMGQDKKSQWSSISGVSGQEQAALVSSILFYPVCIGLYMLYAYRAAIDPLPRQVGKGLTSQPTSASLPIQYKKAGRVLEHTLVLAALLTCTALVAVTYAYPVLQCGVLFCFASPSSSTKDGSIIHVGLLFFFVLLFMSVLPFIGLVRLLYPRRCTSASAQVSEDASSTEEMEEGKNSSSSSSSSPSPSSSPSSSLERVAAFQQQEKSNSFWKHVAFLAVFLGLYPLCLFACMVLPDYFMDFSLSRMKAYAKEEVVPDSSGNPTPMNIHSSSSLTATLYEDMILYYAFIYVLMVTGLLSAHFPAVRAFMHKPVTPSFTVKHDIASVVSELLFGFKDLRVTSLSVGEIFFFLWFLGLSLSTYIWWGGSGWHADYYGEDRDQRTARALGQLSNVMFACLLLPVSRTSVWLDLWGLSYEYSLVFHRAVGYLVAFFVYLHSISFDDDEGGGDRRLKVEAQGASTSRRLDGWEDNFTVSLMSVFVDIAIASVVLTLQIFRRYVFELFYLTHMVYFCIFVGMLWHATSCWYYLLPSLSLWAFDHFLRFLKTSRTVRLTSMSSTTTNSKKDVVEVCYQLDEGVDVLGVTSNMFHLPGQYCFVCVPQISSLEWHPFTLSSSPLNPTKTFTHHIKEVNSVVHEVMAEVLPTWTSKLAQLVKNYQATSSPKGDFPFDMHIDGPYGNPPPLHKHSFVALVSGGIGVTPMMSHLQYYLDLCEVQREQKRKQSSLPDGNDLGERDLSLFDSPLFSTLPSYVLLVWTVSFEEELEPFLSVLERAVRFGQEASDGHETRFFLSVHITRQSKREQTHTKTDEQGNGGESSGVELALVESKTGLDTEQGLDLSDSTQKPSLSPPSSLDDVLHAGRPDLPHILHSCLEDSGVHTEDACVYACGPTGLLQASADASYEMGLRFYEETFEF